MVRTLRAGHDQNRKPDGRAIEILEGRAREIYQAGDPPCAGRGGLDLTFLPGPNEPEEVNALLENVELLEIHSVRIQ